MQEEVKQLQYEAGQEGYFVALKDTYPKVCPGKILCIGANPEISTAEPKSCLPMDIKMAYISYENLGCECYDSFIIDPLIPRFFASKREAFVGALNILSMQIECVISDAVDTEGVLAPPPEQVEDPLTETAAAEKRRQFGYPKLRPMDNRHLVTFNRHNRLLRFRKRGKYV